MITFLAVIHIIACLGLVGLVLIQDSKGGGVFTSQASSNSVLGAGGATTLAQTMTKVVAGIFAATCIGLSIMSARTDRSVIDSAPVTTTATPFNPSTGEQTVPPPQGAPVPKEAPPSVPPEVATPQPPVTK